MFDAKTNLHAAIRHMNKAIRRGDLKAAFGWMLVARRQLDMARSLLDLHTPRHRPWRKRGRG